MVYVWFRFEPDFSIMQFDNVPADIQPQAGSGYIRSLFAFQLVEASEYVVPLWWFDARAVIGDGKNAMRLVFIQAEFNRIAGRRELAGIRDQVAEHLMYAFLIGVDYHTRVW